LYPSTLGILNPNVLDMLAADPLDGLYPTALDTLATNLDGAHLSYLASNDMLLASHYGELRFYDFSDMVSRPSAFAQ
jgi:hypothetical protein